ncbi:MAG: hypothetical protein IJY47_04670 [Clostridia bacterium]|nr:hypothetical protein [Clostridia bacterium]
MEKKTGVKKLLQILLNVIVYLFLAICIFCLIVTVASKKNGDDATQLFGYQMRIVTSSSMERCDATDVSEYDIQSIPIRSMVFIQTVPQESAEADAWYGSLKVGDVLTFRYVYTSQVTITHRITAIEPKEGGYVIRLEGDNKDANSNQLVQTIDTSVENSTNYVIGKVVAKNYLLGLLVTLLKNPVGMVLIVIVPCFIIVLLEVLKIVGVLNAEKKKREQEANLKKDSELEELRRRLAQLELEKTPSSSEPESKEAVGATEENKEHTSEQEEKSHE